MFNRSSGAAVLMLCLVLPAGSALAGPMLVRVAARDYQEIYSHIQFKGTSIEIAGARPGQSYDLLLNRADFGAVQASGLGVTVIHDDMGTVKDEAGQEGMYRSFDEMKTVFRNLASTYPTICRLESIGPTYQGRYLLGLKISDNPTVDEDEPEVLLEAQHHAREWATPEAARYFADTLIRNYAGNSTFRNFVDNHELWVFPTVNADGYVYDYPGQQYWRKNRQPFSSATGCDPNRDYNGACNGNRMDDWGALVSGSRSSHQPGDETFFGAKGAWGFEITALSEFFKTRTFLADVTLHSYSELVLWPFGSGSVTPDNAYYSNLGQRIAAQMSALGGGTYTPEQSNSLYPTAGGSCDWMYGWAHWIGGFPCMSFTFELGTDFYQPTGDLDAIQRECFDGLFYLFSRADSIQLALEGAVPRPFVGAMDSSNTGNYIVHWTPVRPTQNHPDKWELEELSGLTVVEDNMESGLSKWNVQGATQSSTQKHGGTYSASLGNGNNISNYISSKDPYPVKPGDSLKYWIWYNIESNYDVTVAEVSLEGREWCQLHDRFSGNSSGWQRKAFSLAPWVGKSVFIRFRYMTDDGTTGSGVYIDDVSPVPTFGTRNVISNNITDTLYSVTGKAVGTYYYRVRGHNTAWNWGDQGPLEDIVVTGSGVAENPAPGIVTSIFNVGPNPVTRGTLVSYALERPGVATLDVYDATGRRVRILASGTHKAGSYTATWDSRDAGGRDVPAGIYYVRLSADNTSTAPLAVVR
jgi:hypothetical protein